MRLVPLSAALVVGFSGCSPTQLKCQPLTANSHLRHSIRIVIPSAETSRFNQRVVAFLNSSGFTFETSSGRILSVPDAEGRTTEFDNFKTIGCTSKVIVWSENVARENEFIVTVHETVFGDQADASRVATGLRAALVSR